MADEDKESRTEEPSQRKLEKAREQGQVPRSRELNTFFMLLGLLIIVGATLPMMVQHTFQFMGGIFQEMYSFEANRESVQDVFILAAQALFFSVIPSLGLLVVLALFGSFIQTGFLFSTESIVPKFNRISLMKGFERLFSFKSLAEFIKACIKMVIVGTVLWWVVSRNKSDLILLLDETVFDMVEFTGVLVFRMVLGVVIIMALLGATDFLYQRFEFMRDQRMTMHELKEEFKDTQGDPHIRARQRQIRIERARSRMMSEVPKANVVITNPTHFAVALRYDPAQDPAPRLLAKGADHIAQKIRELAKEHDIPMVENPELARALYRQVDLDELIPLDLYETVSKVIAYVMNLKKTKKRV